MTGRYDDAERRTTHSASARFCFNARMQCLDATSINYLGWDLPVSASECSTT